MLRRVVCVAAGLLAAAIVGCSDQSMAPLASDNPMISKTLTQDLAGIPYVQNVHLAAIPIFDDPHFAPMSFNDFGEVVGSYDSTVFKWEGSRGVTFLTLPVDTFANAAGFDVNDKGQVVITVSNPPPSLSKQAAIWDWYGHVTMLRPLGIGFSCAADAINNLGVVVGTCGNVHQDLLTVWTAYGNPDALYPSTGGPPLSEGLMFSISDAGYITGAIEGKPFIFTPSKQVTILTTESRFSQVPHDVNDSGWVAGTNNSPDGSFDAALWTGGLTLHDIYPQGDGGMFGITDDGIAVGSVDELKTNVFVPVIWTSANGLERLPFLEPGYAGQVETGEALYINTHHQILGWVKLASGQQRWVMWTLPF